MKKIVALIFISSISSNILAQDDCAFAIGKDKTYSIFPMDNINKTWVWYENPIEKNQPEYMWSIEAGRMNNEEEFVADGVLLSYSIGSFITGENHIRNGSIDNLIEDGSGSIYYSNKEKNSIIPLGRKNIFAKKDEESIIVYSTTGDIKNFILQTNPTHFKMKYSSITKIDNFTCIAPILNLDNNE